MEIYGHDCVGYNPSIRKIMENNLKKKKKVHLYFDENDTIVIHINNQSKEIKVKDLMA